MDREADLPAPPETAKNLLRPIPIPIARPFPSSSSSTSSSSSPPDFVRHVQAAFKRHRPLGTMQLNSLRPRRVLVPQRETSESLAYDAGLAVETEKLQDVASSRQDNAGHNFIEQRESLVAVVGEAPEDSFTTPPSITGTMTKTHDENLNPFSVQTDQTQPDPNWKSNDVITLSHVVSGNLPSVDGLKKVQFSSGSNTDSQKMEWDVSNQVEMSTASNHDLKQRDFQHAEMLDTNLRSGGGISSLLAKRNALVEDQQHQFMAFSGEDSSHHMTQSSVVSATCATTMSVYSTSAPMLNSTAYSRRDSGSHMGIEPLEEINVNPRPITQGDSVQPSCPTFQCTNGTVVDQTAVPTQASGSAFGTSLGVNDHSLSKGQQDCVLKESDRLHDGSVDCGKGSSHFDYMSTKGRGISGNVPDVQSQAPLTRNSSSNVKSKSSKSEKPEKAVSGKGASVSRKKNHDADLFFKVNGKLCQKLGKIGSGGSSEVYKVISSDCTIYALKKIKLKGRDYSTAYGFCQEIEYLNKLKGKNNIIQLIDYEVTDKTLLREVMNGSMSIKDGSIKDDGYIFMVLEYGEIDLAHMLSQKWKEMDSSNWTIDENWLRFYWQQILQAVNTIHEERIVHSDLKPANFLLVKGSLKLIDFGIAKAIMSDTTNIQRDSQVGTLSYMSPEAFMCNENDAEGNTIKCGRPSDIWSLGCILYQMVYGRTPFAEYKTFWAKFKVITNRNHEIIYGPVSNPWLLDLMKKCLAWERSERWRIPQLLQHPFLVPPIPSQFSLPQDQRCKFLQIMAETYGNDQEMSRLCSQLQQLLTEPVPPITSQLSTSQNQHSKLLLQMSSLCYQLQQHLVNLGKEAEYLSM